MLISSNIIGTPITITAATIGTCSYIDFIDIIGAGVGNWNLASITGGVGDGGGNSGITFNTPKNCYMKTAINSAWTANGSWMTTSGGSTPIVPGVPLLQDTAIFDVNSITTTGKTITLDSYGICNVNFTGVANSPAITYIHQVIFYGSVTLVSGMIHTGAFGVSLSGRGSPTFDGGTLTWPASSTITVNTAPTSTYSLSRNLISSSPIVATSGGLNGNGYTMSFTTCTVNGGKLTLGGLLTLTSTLALSAGTLDMNGSGITGLTTTTISGTGLLKLSGQVNNSGAISVTGGSISNTGGSGELKGTTGSFSGGTSVVEKLTLSSTLALSSTGSLTIDNNGSASYSAMPTMTGASCRLITSQGATFTNTSIAVAADSDIDSGGGGGSSTFGS
jgi:filamentous hemagglutinin